MDGEWRPHHGDRRAHLGPAPVPGAVDPGAGSPHGRRRGARRRCTRCTSARRGARSRGTRRPSLPSRSSLGELIVHLAAPTVRGAARKQPKHWSSTCSSPSTSRRSTHRCPRTSARVGSPMRSPSIRRTRARSREWGRVVGASERTLSRRFTEETGLTFTEWRTQARLIAALPRLAHGAAVANVALEVGYANPSAFIAAFRRVFGVTPRAYFDRPRRPGPARPRSPPGPIPASNPGRRLSRSHHVRVRGAVLPSRPEP